jgi:hypothetical protein
MQITQRLSAASIVVVTAVAGLVEQSVTFSRATYASLAIRARSSRQTGDFNVDGRLDIATADQSGHSMTVLLNTTSFAGRPQARRERA